MGHAPSPPAKSATALGFLCGAGAALCWAIGFVAARHGINTGLSPLVIALHRYVWPGLALLPYVAVNSPGDLAGVGWRRGLTLAIFGGLPLALLSYLGYLFVPLGHGGIIQPSCAALGGLVLARAVLKEPLPARRVAGALAIVLGLAVIGAEAFRTIGAHGVGGDLLFVAAGSFFAVFGMLVRLWRVDALRAAAITSVLSLLGVPILLFTFDNAVATGFRENLLQAVTQGALAGAGAIYLFTRAVVLLGASRAVLFPSLVSPFVLLIGFLALGEVPSVSQLIGLAIVIVGFRLTQRA
ncbi:MAG: DMT family transporter [Xanthobacteraceae bacterium]|nr:DMT family transporter [Xanthobacteraceae bacterium]